MANQGYCLDHSPTKLSRDLWGYLNLSLAQSSRDRALFDNAVGGNGFDAWRRITEPIAPNSRERLFQMHRDIVHPKPSKHIRDVLHDLNTWEGNWKSVIGAVEANSRTKPN